MPRSCCWLISESANHPKDQTIILKPWKQLWWWAESLLDRYNIRVIHTAWIPNGATSNLRASKSAWTADFVAASRLQHKERIYCQSHSQWLQWLHFLGYHWLCTCTKAVSRFVEIQEKWTAAQLCCQTYALCIGLLTVSMDASLILNYSCPAQHVPLYQSTKDPVNLIDEILHACMIWKT